MSYGIDKAIEEIQEQVGAEMRSSYDFMIASRGWTPIEALFWVMLTRANEVTGGHPFRFYEIKGERVSLQDLFAKNEDGVSLFPQCWLADWPVDFVLVDHDSRRALVIECDGHDFHERTKEQAAKDRSRDRALQQLGCTVFRFTGSELYRDPFRKAMEVVDWTRVVVGEGLT